MTTIAFDGRTLAVDRASWKANYVWNETTKLFLVKPHSDVWRRFSIKKIPDGAQDDIQTIAWAAAGEAEDVPIIITWMRESGDPPSLGKEARGLILDTYFGGIYSLTSRLTLEPFERMPVADGGGFEIALGAMLAGKTAIEAIEIVQSRSGWAAGGYNSYTLTQEAYERSLETKLKNI